jgi:hypothetical protein
VLVQFSFVRLDEVWVDVEAELSDGSGERER